MSFFGTQKYKARPMPKSGLEEADASGAEAGSDTLNGNCPSRSTSAFPIGPSPACFSWAKLLEAIDPRGGDFSGRLPKIVAAERKVASLR